MYITSMGIEKIAITDLYKFSQEKYCFQMKTNLTYPEVTFCNYNRFKQSSLNASKCQRFNIPMNQL